MRLSSLPLEPFGARLTALLAASLRARASRRARAFVRACLVATSTLPLACCSSDAADSANAADDGAGGQCDTPAGYAFIYACENSALGVNTCTDYFSNVSKEALVGLEQTCTALGGTISSTRCDPANSLGSCTISSSAGSLGIYAVLTTYVSPGLTQANVRADCAGGYSAPGEPLVLPDGQPAGGPQCAARSRASDYAFSIALRANGEVINCVNYYGNIDSATQAQLGGEAVPCPEASASGTCERTKDLIPGATRYEEVGYASEHGQAITQTDCERSGGRYSPTYRAP